MKKDRILIVDDEPLNRVLLESVLDVLGYESRAASNGAQALSMLNEDIDLVLLDVNMPELTGFDVTRRIRALEDFADIPVIMVTALNSMQDRLAAVEAGANDFICKPVDRTELRIRVASQLRVKHAQDAVKQYYRELESKVEERTQSLQEANAKLAQLATTDVVTGLPNHRSLVTTLEETIQASLSGGSQCALLFIDLDHFKALNDSCGHAVGDSVLEEVGEILGSVLGSDGTCGRWGGEEFVCILPNADLECANDWGEKIRVAVAQRAFRGGAGCHITCSIGVAIAPLDGTERSSIAEAADKAMYVAKSLGRNQVRAASDVLAGFSALQSETWDRETIALEGLIEALMGLIDARDEKTGFHSREVQRVSMRTAEVMNLSLDEIQFVGLVARLHDIGKVAVPDSVLQEEGALTSEQWDRMRMHCEIGAGVVGRVPSLRAAAPAIRSHHERWDGAGYPDGLTGEEIPLASRIVAAADAFVAMTVGRSYRKARTTDEAFVELHALSGRQFDPTVIAALQAGYVEDIERKAA